MDYDVAVIGLGYVGLTLAVALADTGFRVLGVEKRGRRGFQIERPVQDQLLQSLHAANVVV